MVIVAIVIIGREIAISALREWMAEIGARGRVAVSGVGKIEDHHADRRPVDAAVPARTCVGMPIYRIGLLLTASRQC